MVFISFHYYVSLWIALWFFFLLSRLPLDLLITMFCVVLFFVVPHSRCIALPSFHDRDLLIF